MIEGYLNIFLVDGHIILSNFTYLIIVGYGGASDAPP